MAINPRTPNRTLLQLGEDASTSVRLKLSEREDLSENLYNLLANDKSNKVVRQLLLSHGHKISKNFVISQKIEEKMDHLSDRNFLDIVSLRIFHKQ